MHFFEKKYHGKQYRIMQIADNHMVEENTQTNIFSKRLTHMLHQLINSIISQ